MSVAVLADDSVAFIRGVHSTRATGEFDIAYSMSPRGTISHKAQMIKDTTIKMIAPQFLGGSFPKAGGVIHISSTATEKDGHWCVNLTTVNAQKQSSDPKQVRILSLLKSQIIPMYAKPSSREQSEKATDAQPVDISDYPESSALFEGVYLIERDAKVISHTSLCEFVTVLQGHAENVDVAYSLKGLEAICKQSASRGHIDSLRDMARLELLEKPESPKAAAKCALQFVPGLTKMAPDAESSAQTPKETPKEKEAPEEPPPRKRKRKDAPAKPAKKSKKADGQDSDSLSTPVTSDSDGDDTGAGIGGPNMRHKSSHPLPHPDLVPPSVDASTALTLFFSTSVAIKMREKVGLVLDDKLPTDQAERLALVSYLQGMVSSLEAIIGTEYRSKAVTPGLAGVYERRAAASLALAAIERGEVTSHKRDSASRALGPAFESDAKKAKYNKPLATASDELLAIRSTTNAALISASTEDEYSKAIKAITGGDAASDHLVGMRSSLRKESTRFFMSNAKVNAAGTTDPTLAYAPSICIDALRAISASSIASLRQSVADEGCDIISNEVAKRLITASFQGSLSYTLILEGLRDLKGANKPAPNTHVEINMAWSLLEDVLSQVMVKQLGIPNFSSDLQSLHKKVNQTAQNNGIQVDKRVMYISRVLDAWNEAIVSFRDGRLDRLPGLERDAISPTKTFYDYECLSAKIAKERKLQNPKPTPTPKPKPTPRKPSNPTPPTKPPPVKSTPTAPPPTKPTGGAGTPDPNRPCNGHATKSGWKTRKFISDAATLDTVCTDFRTTYPNLCSSFNVRVCSLGANCKFSHDVPADMQAFSDKHGLEMTF